MAVDAAREHAGVGHVARGVTAATMLAALRRVGGGVLFVVMPLVAASLAFYGMREIGALAFDWEGTIWRPLQAVLNGDSPYGPATARGVDVGNPSVYPPLTFLLALPTAPLPYAWAAAAWMVALVAAVGLSLRLVGVRDWRCYALAASSFPVLNGLGLGNATLLLPLGLALAWRFRDCAWRAGVAVAGTVALKLLLWPLFAWLVFTRRFRAALVAGLAACVALVASWATIGFEGMAEYPKLLRVVTQVFGEHSISVAAAAIGLGLTPGQATALAVIGGTLVLAVAAWLARRPAGDAPSLVAVTAAALVFSPVVWHHYFAVLVVGVAVLSPAYSRLWLVFPASTLVAWTLPWSQGGADVCCRPADVPEKVWAGLHGSPPFWQIGGYSALLGIVLVTALRAARRA